MQKPEAKPEIVVCLTTAGLKCGHDIVTVRVGEAWDANDPIVKLYPSLFTSVAYGAPVRRTVRPVEKATAVPGERR